MSNNLLKNHWTRDAACNFDVRLASHVEEDILEMKKFCNNCSVRSECRSWSEEIDSILISDGTTRYERLLGSWKRVDDINESNFR